MIDLQDKLSKFSQERIKILKENEILKKRNETLEKENIILKNRVISTNLNISCINSSQNKEIDTSDSIFLIDNNTVRILKEVGVRSY